MFYDNNESLGFYIGHLCSRDSIFYTSLKQLINETEKRFQHRLDML